MDELDKKILELLQKDARLSYREIARKLGSSHANIANRIENMEKNKIIQGYTVVLNPEDFNLYPLCFQISIKPGVEVASVGQVLAGFDDVSMVSRVTGSCDLLALALCNNKNEAMALLSKVSAIPGINKVESHVVIEAMKLDPKWQLQK